MAQRVFKEGDRFVYLLSDFSCKNMRALANYNDAQRMSKDEYIWRISNIIEYFAALGWKGCYFPCLSDEAEDFLRERGFTLSSGDGWWVYWDE